MCLPPTLNSSETTTTIYSLTKKSTPSITYVQPLFQFLVHSRPHGFSKGPIQIPHKEKALETAERIFEHHWWKTFSIHHQPLGKATEFDTIIIINKWAAKCTA